MKIFFHKGFRKVFLVQFLFFFMLFIFGPAEIFFANSEEFTFVYNDFGGYLAALALFLTFACTLVALLLPEWIGRAVTSLVFGGILSGYLQIMFLNGNLDLLGENPDGYRAGAGKAVANALLWLVIMGISLVCAFRKQEFWDKVTVYVSVFLLCIQMVAMVSLLVMAQKEDYRRGEGQWHLTGEEQYKVSADRNIIVFVLDYFSDNTLEKMKLEYPEAADFLHDFTYYSNDDCVYMGTFPSLPHMLTGCDYDTAMKVNDWCGQIWQDENTVDFYEKLHEQNYVVNVYTPDIHMLCGGNDAVLLEGKISNLSDEQEEIDVFYKLLFATMTKMSCYRMAPEALKPFFYSDSSRYGDIVKVAEHPVDHDNYDFHQSLLEHGLEKTEGSNYLIVQHLMGVHELDTDAQGRLDPYNHSIEATASGALAVVEKYLTQLKELGVYDDSAIIITADHGDFDEPSVIFYVKGFEETHEQSPVNDAPVSHCEFLPTLADYAGLDYVNYGSGRSVWDIAPGEERERYFLCRAKSSKYPAVPLYTGERSASFNIFKKFIYHGELTVDRSAPDEIIPMVDSFN